LDIKIILEGASSEMLDSSFSSRVRERGI